MVFDNGYNEAQGLTTIVYLTETMKNNDSIIL